MTDPYVVLVSGWRGATDDTHANIIRAELIVYRFLDQQTILRHGKCKYGGVDLIADRIGHDWGWTIDPMPAEERDGRILGSARNRAMCTKHPHPDLLLAFPGPGSTGTWDCLHWAARYGIPFRGVPLTATKGPS